MQHKIFSPTIFIICSLIFSFNLSAQTDSLKDEGVDLYDLIGNISHHFDITHYDSLHFKYAKNLDPSAPDLLIKDSLHFKSRRYHIPVIPVIGYSLATGAVIGFATSVAFYTTESNEANVSNTLMQVFYTQNNQVIFMIQPVIWTNENKYLIKGDYIYLNYPTQTFGLGNRTTERDINYIDYSHIRIYQTALRQIIPDFFLGLGYNLDYHWDITQQGNSEKKIYTNTNYLFTPSSVSSGFTLNFVYDNRRNSINPQSGFYLNTVLRENETFLGSDQNWQSLLIDVRKYFTFPGKAKNVLAFWSYNNISLKGNPPYLDLPATGLDEYGNTGRGYIQGRFRGKNMYDLESEFRFRITKNGLLGGVVFANVQSFSKNPDRIIYNGIPGGGLGIRIKVHKHTNTNLCIDYGFANDGSSGFFLNLNEVF